MTKTLRIIVSGMCEKELEEDVEDWTYGGRGEGK